MLIAAMRPGYHGDDPCEYRPSTSVPTGSGWTNVVTAACWAMQADVRGSDDRRTHMVTLNAVGVQRSSTSPCCRVLKCPSVSARHITRGGGVLGGGDRNNSGRFALCGMRWLAVCSSKNAAVVASDSAEASAASTPSGE